MTLLGLDFDNTLVSYDEMFHKIADNLRDVLPHVNAVNFTAVEALFHPRIWEIIDTLREINPDIGIRIDSNGRNSPNGTRLTFL